MTSAPPNPTRRITSNDEKGNSYFTKTIPESLPITMDLGGALARLAYTTERPPTQTTKNKDLNEYEKSITHEPPPLVRSDGGTNIWFVDTPPQGESPVHRTISVDIVVHILGELELTLTSFNGNVDGECEKRIIKPGDVTIQRATLHKWRNPSKTQWARMLAVMNEAQPVVVNEGGTTLKTEFL